MASKIWKHSELVAIDVAGTSGGIGIIWNPYVFSLTNLMETRFSISTEFHILGTSTKALLTHVYGPFALADKQIFLLSLKTMSHLVGRKNWILGGDFILIRNLQEKKGGIRTLSPTSNYFDTLIENLALVDINTDNGWHTWTNK